MRDFSIVKEIIEERKLGYRELSSVSEISMSYDVQIEGSQIMHMYNLSQLTIEKIYLLQNNLALVKTPQGVLIIFSEPHFGIVPEYHQFVRDLEIEYNKRLADKLEKIRQENIRLTKKKLQESEKEYMSKEQLEQERKQHLFLQREQARLEQIKRLEEEKMKELIEQKKEMLIQRAKAYGFEIQVNQTEEGGYLLTCIK